MPLTKPRPALIASLVLLCLATTLAAQTSSSNSGVLSYGNARLTYDSTKWTAEPWDEPGKWKLARLGGEVFGGVYFIRYEIPVDRIADSSLERLRAANGNVKVVSQENRTIAGVPVRVLRLEYAYHGIPVTALGCYYGGRYGAAQIVVGTPRALFDEYQSDLNELCEGLEMSAPGKSAETTGSAVAEYKNTQPETHSSANQAPAAPAPPAIFILTSGERIESSKYTLTAKSLTIEQEDKPRTIPISALNIDATVAANRARGVDIKIPTSKNQIMLGF